MAKIPELCPSGAESILRNLASYSFALRRFGGQKDLKGSKGTAAFCGGGTQGLLPLLLHSEDTEAL